MIDNKHSDQAGSDLQDPDAYHDARAIIRLFQCLQCSHPLREPMTLPCGKSVCRRCLPPLYKRDNITYPSNPGRAEGFVCPFTTCRLEHSFQDCSVDVTLKKVLSVVSSEFERYKVKGSDAPSMSEDTMHRKYVVDSSLDTMLHSRLLHRSRLVAAYVLAELGELDYNSDLVYTPVVSHADTTKALDIDLLRRLKEGIRIESECQVCYSLMLDPLTTPCGHTFCRRCVARVLDHSNVCPVCRRSMSLPPGVQAVPTNNAISHIISRLYPRLLQARLTAAEHDDQGDANINIPLFPCTLAYPDMPTFLHIFEPRYRLMIRRVVESEDRQFGILMYNRRDLPQGGLGQTRFVQYGTLLRVQNVEMFSDGRSLVETQGTSRFRVLETAMRDGYMVGKIQRVDDVSLQEEEALESHETSGPQPAPNDALGKLNHMSTERLLHFGLDFISRAQAASEPWLAERFLSVYGPPPPDPAIFPYWFASVLPISEDEKYQLLPTTSVRERLKIVARWIQRLEAARCMGSCFRWSPASRLGETSSETELAQGITSQSTRLTHSPSPAAAAAAVRYSNGIGHAPASAEQPS